MKVLQFTIPLPYDKSVIVETVCQSYHYPYLHRHKEVQLTWIKKGEGTLIAGNNMAFFNEQSFGGKGSSKMHSSYHDKCIVFQYTIL